MAREYTEQYWKSVFTDPQGMIESDDISIRERNQQKLRSHFLEKGFVPDKIAIPSLDVQVELNSNEFYLFDHVDLVSTANNLRRALGKDIAVRSNKGYCGSCQFNSKGEDGVAYIVLVSNSLDGLEKTIYEGHENGHFIWNKGKQGLIYAKYNIFLQDQCQINDTEDFAHLCGYIALKKTGNNLLTIVPFGSEPGYQASAEKTLTIARKLIF